MEQGWGVSMLRHGCLISIVNHAYTFLLLHLLAVLSMGKHNYTVLLSQNDFTVKQVALISLYIAAIFLYTVVFNSKGLYLIGILFSVYHWHKFE